jgi:nucleoporin NUP42
VFGSGGFSAFAGQPSAFGLGAGASTTTPQTTGGSVFGQSSFGTPATQTQTSVFGAPAPAQSAFGASVPSAFGQPQGPVSAFAGSAFPLNTTNTNPQSGSGSVFGPGGGTSGSVFSSSNNQMSTPFAPQTNQPTSAFAPIQAQPPSALSTASQPLSAFPSQIKPPPAGPPDFLNAKSTYRPGLTPYDQLPDGYINMIPPKAMEAFKSQRFEWGKVPDWIPPKELR